MTDTLVTRETLKNYSFPLLSPIIPNQVYELKTFKLKLKDNIYNVFAIEVERSDMFRGGNYKNLEVWEKVNDNDIILLECIEKYRANTWTFNVIGGADIMLYEISWFKGVEGYASYQALKANATPKILYQQDFANPGELPELFYVKNRKPGKVIMNINVRKNIITKYVYGIDSKKDAIFATHIF